MHSRSQDKLDKDDPDKEKKDKKKEKRNSKHQEIFDKEFKPTDVALPQSEAVILSETVISRGAFPCLLAAAGPIVAPHLAEGGCQLGFSEWAMKSSFENLGCPAALPLYNLMLRGTLGTE